jgi:hypothetical protein
MQGRSLSSDSRASDDLGRENSGGGPSMVHRFRTGVKADVTAIATYPSPIVDEVRS